MKGYVGAPGTAMTLGYVMGEAPFRLLVLIILTNWSWIPFIAWYDFAIRRRLAGRSGALAISDPVRASASPHP